MKGRVRVIPHQDTAVLMGLLPQIQELADSERETLGFLPAVALEEAITRQRLLAAAIEADGCREFAGYLLHSGIFPSTKIQQIAVVSQFRKCGVASALLKVLASELERLGFLTISAHVASDLPGALLFYSANGFENIRQRIGGQAQGRTIFVHVRQLDTDNLFSFADDKSGTNFDPGIRRRRAGETPFFAFDLNVYFDLVRDRTQSSSPDVCSEQRFRTTSA